jgi:hypothetical protein
MRPLQAHCHLGLGTLYATIGRRAEARAELSAAIERIERPGMASLQRMQRPRRLVDAEASCQSMWQCSSGL